MRVRARRLAGQRLTKDGELVITARRYRKEDSGPEIEAILDDYDIGCGPCMVGTCILKEIMEAHVGIVREGAVLEAGIAKLEALQARLAQLHASGGRDYNPGWHLCLDLHNMILTSLAVTRAGLERTESRGAHTRIDYPDYDDELGQVNLVIRRSVGEMVVVRTPLPDMPAELAKFVAQETV